MKTGILICLNCGIKPQRKGMLTCCHRCSVEYQKQYQKTDKYKQYKKQYQKTDKYKQYQKQYQKTDKYKQYKKQYYQRKKKESKWKQQRQ